MKKEPKLFLREIPQLIAVEKDEHGIPTKMGTKYEYEVVEIQNSVEFHLGEKLSHDRVKDITDLGTYHVTVKVFKEGR